MWNKDWVDFLWCPWSRCIYFDYLKQSVMPRPSLRHYFLIFVHKDQWFCQPLIAVLDRTEVHILVIDLFPCPSLTFVVLGLREKWIVNLHRNYIPICLRPLHKRIINRKIKRSSQPPPPPTHFACPLHFV